MILQINMSSDVPIYMQLRNQIVMGIGCGELKAGQDLPTVRQLAEDIGINMMTVSKAYTILKNEGFIEIDRRHGAKVRKELDPNQQFCEKLEAELFLLAAESKARGMDKADFFELCEKIFSHKLKEKHL
ncbi:MAG: GntR family transcriptional regulator [Dehalococcoidales bacterium]